MTNLFKRLWGSSMANGTNQAERDLQKTCAGRIVSALTFIIVIACLGMWIIFFLLVKDHLSMQPLSGSVLSNLTCIMFFGGLILAFFVGTMAGNFLRRSFWKWLVRRSR